MNLEGDEAFVFCSLDVQIGGLRGGADLLLCPALERLRSSFGAIKTVGLATNTFNLDFTTPLYFIIHILFFTVACKTRKVSTS